MYRKWSKYILVNTHVLLLCSTRSFWQKVKCCEQELTKTNVTKCMFHSSFGSINEILASLLLGQVNNWLASFFQKFYGREEGFYFYYFFDSEVLMLKYNKTYPYLLSFLHPSVTTSRVAQLLTIGISTDDKVLRAQRIIHRPFTRSRYRLDIKLTGSATGSPSRIVLLLA